MWSVGFRDSTFHKIFVVVIFWILPCFAGKCPVGVMGCLEIVKLLFYFNLFLILAPLCRLHRHFSTSFRKLRTIAQAFSHSLVIVSKLPSPSPCFPLKEEKDFVGYCFLNPSLLCGEVPRRGDGVLGNCLNFHYLI